jgi:hypothetical protein
MAGLDGYWLIDGRVSNATAFTRLFRKSGRLLVGLDALLF